MIKINFSDISIRVIKSTFKTRFTLARACRRSPLMAKIVEKILFEGDHMLVIPRDNAVKSENVKLTDIQVGKEFQLPENDVLPSIVLKEIIKKSKNRVIMNSCICRVSSGCKDYPHDLGCIFLGRGAENISPKLGRRVSIEEALKHVEECQKAGLVHIIGRNKIDSLWLNTGPKEELLSICNCCPCCCLWKMTPELPLTLGRSINPMLGTKIQFKPELCIGCGNCTEDVCFMELITMDGNKVKIDLEKCRSCGRCVETCKNGALTIEVDSDSIEKSIKRVQSLVDV